MKFFKYHGAGNDFILIDNLRDEIPEKNKPSLAEKLCHRRFGIGGDGLVLVEGSSVADVKMRIFNPDGSEPEMCGNAIRCLAKYVYDKGVVRKEEIAVETLAGVKEVEATLEDGEVAYVKVDIGAPIFEREEIPAVGRGRLLREKVKTEEGEVEISAVNTGVPHAVVFVEDVEEADVIGMGRAIRYSEIFPEGANVNFVQRLGENVFKVRTYERGVEDETLACGTGIVACGAVAVELGEAEAGRPMEIRARGGKIYIEVEEGRMSLKGPVEFVFEGDVGV